MKKRLMSLSTLMLATGLVVSTTSGTAGATGTVGTGPTAQGSTQGSVLGATASAVNSEPAGGGVLGAIESVGQGALPSPASRSGWPGRPQLR